MYKRQGNNHPTSESTKQPAMCMCQAASGIDMCNYYIMRLAALSAGRNHWQLSLRTKQGDKRCECQLMNQVNMLDNNGQLRLPLL